MYYKNIDNNLNGTFNLIDTLFYVQNNKPYNIREGYKTSITYGMLNNDSFPDIIIGNYAGGLSYYQGSTPPHISIGIKSFSDNITANNLSVYPNPCKDILNLSHPELNILHIAIVDIYGKFIMSTYTNKTMETMDISSLKPGMYFIKITLENKQCINKKIIKNE